MYKSWKVIKEAPQGCVPKEIEDEYRTKRQLAVGGERRYISSMWGFFTPVFAHP